jgi:hypothetical protein
VEAIVATDRAAEAAGIALAQCRTMTDFELVTAADVQLIQALARRVTAAHPGLVGTGSSYGELAWI